MPEHEWSAESATRNKIILKILTRLRNDLNSGLRYSAEVC